MSIPEQILDDWYIRVAVTQRAHYLSADHFGKLKYWLGIPAVVLSTLVGTSLFATLQKQPEPRLQICRWSCECRGCASCEPSNISWLLGQGRETPSCGSKV